MYINLKSLENLFAHDLLLSCHIVLKFCTEHGSATAMLCANFQNDMASETDVLDERDFSRFELSSDILHRHSLQDIPAWSCQSEINGQRSMPG